MAGSVMGGKIFLENISGRERFHMPENISGFFPVFSGSGRRKGLTLLGAFAPAAWASPGSDDAALPE
jgi:hypothetical protein